ncbi:MAG: hypothetical protein K6E94_04300 [Elusimicrobiaceae bacterium]|nr:hypothetical protein [Elusimicrobiaceae bacterium]
MRNKNIPFLFTVALLVGLFSAASAQLVTDPVVPPTGFNPGRLLEDSYKETNFYAYVDLLIRGNKQINKEEVAARINEITPENRYNLLALCIDSSKIDQLVVLLDSGFDENISTSLLLNSRRGKRYENLLFKAVKKYKETNDSTAFKVLVEYFYVPEDDIFNFYDELLVQVRNYQLQKEFNTLFKETKLDLRPKKVLSMPKVKPHHYAEYITLTPEEKARREIVKDIEQRMKQDRDQLNKILKKDSK